MRVMLLVTDHERGGTPNRLARLARGLHAAGVEVLAGCLAPPGPVSAELESAGIQTFACNAQGTRDLPALKRLADTVRRERPDLIHATLTHANVAARLVGTVQRVPVIGSTATIELERRWHRAVERASAAIDRAHIVNSAAVADHVIETFGIAPDRVHIVPPSIDMPQLIDRDRARTDLELSPTDFVVAWVGRFDPVKRLDLLVRCAELMAGTHPTTHVAPASCRCKHRLEACATSPGMGSNTSTRFLLVGDGPERENIERMVRAGGAADLVDLLGWRSDVGPILSAADAFLLPSLTEGMPNAVLEAMASGLAVVGSDIPALRELSADGDLLRITPGDQPQDFANALLELRTDCDARTALGRRAAQWAHQNLDPQATVAATMAVYQQVLGQSTS